MDVSWSLFFCAAGLALVFESVPYLLFPHRMKEVLQTLANAEPARLQRWGMAALLAGVTVIWLARTL